MFVDNNLYGRATGLAERGKYGKYFAPLGGALDVVVKDLLTEKNDFFDSLADRWSTMFPALPIRPGRFEDGIIFLYVKSAPLLFAMRPKLAMIKAKLRELPGCPKKLDVKLEARAR